MAQAPYGNAQILELGIPNSIVNGTNYGVGPFAVGVTSFQVDRAVTVPGGCIRTLYNPKVNCDLLLLLHQLINVVPLLKVY